MLDSEVAKAMTREQIDALLAKKDDRELTRQDLETQPDPGEDALIVRFVDGANIVSADDRYGYDFGENGLAIYYLDNKPVYASYSSSEATEFEDLDDGDREASKTRFLECEYWVWGGRVIEALRKHTTVDGSPTDSAKRLAKVKPERLDGALGDGKIYEAVVGVAETYRTSKKQVEADDYDEHRRALDCGTDLDE